MELRGPWTFAPAKSRGRAENAEPGAGVIGQLWARNEPHHRHHFHQVEKMIQGCSKFQQRDLQIRRETPKDNPEKQPFCEG
jgi:hypothetical protein